MSQLIHHLVPPLVELIAQADGEQTFGKVLFHSLFTEFPCARRLSGRGILLRL